MELIPALVRSAASNIGLSVRRPTTFLPLVFHVVLPLQRL